MALRGPLPFMKSIADAEALVEKEGDPFYLDAFMIETWLGQVALEAANQYAGKKKARERAVQAGHTWQAFLNLFGHANHKEMLHVLQSLYRFAEHDDVQAAILRRTIVPLSFEHECFSDFIGPKTMNLARNPREGGVLVRRSIERWCDWIDACTHWQTHACWHLVPLQFDPDPEKRELAALGTNQRFFGSFNDFSREWWQWHHGEAAKRFKGSPKWQMVGKAMAAQEERHWTYPELDEMIIWFWPLLKRYNWTYRDMMNVVRDIRNRPAAYPCEGEKDLASYCSNVLGLRKSGHGKTAKNGRPVAYGVAMRLAAKPSPPPS